MRTTSRARAPRREREIDFSFEYDYDRRGSQKVWQLVKPDGDDDGTEPDRLRRF